MNIELKDIQKYKKEISEVSEDNCVFIDVKGQTKFAIIPISLYDEIELALEQENNMAKPEVRIATLNPQALELTYDEYEKIKDSIMKAVEKSLKPKPEKLN